MYIYIYNMCIYIYINKPCYEKCAIELVLKNYIGTNIGTGSITGTLTPRHPRVMAPGIWVPRSERVALEA